MVKKEVPDLTREIVNEYNINEIRLILDDLRWFLYKKGEHY